MVRATDVSPAPQVSAAPTKPANNITETIEEKLRATETPCLWIAFHFRRWQLVPKRS